MFFATPYSLLDIVALDNSALFFGQVEVAAAYFTADSAECFISDAGNHRTEA